MSERLSKEDAALFYKLFYPLLDYVNEKEKAVPGEQKYAGADHVEPNNAYKIASALWDKPSLIDGYLKKYGSSLSRQEAEIVASWKNVRKGRYIVERYLKRGTVFIGVDNEVYLVSGIVSSIDEMLWMYKTPVMVEASLIPFKDVIITDGLIQSFSITFGSGIKNMLKEQYMRSKKAGKIHDSL